MVISLLFELPLAVPRSALQDYLLGLLDSHVASNNNRVTNPCQATKYWAVTGLVTPHLVIARALQGMLQLHGNLSLHSGCAWFPA